MSIETFLADTAAADPDGNGIPRWVEDDFRAYLRCGILAHGFARIAMSAAPPPHPARQASARSSEAVQEGDGTELGLTEPEHVPDFDLDQSAGA